MHYAQIRKYDVANGEGIRTTLFVSGCHFNCKGCFNKEYQDFAYGSMWNKEIEDTFIKYGKDDNVTGFSILGGEPLIQDFDTMANLLRRNKTETNKSIWMWTGFRFENLSEQQRKIISYVDVLVDGQFIEEEKDLRLQWKGSKNQRVIDVRKSLLRGEVILYDTSNL